MVLWPKELSTLLADSSHRDLARNSLCRTSIFVENTAKYQTLLLDRILKAEEWPGEFQVGLGLIKLGEGYPLTAVYSAQAKLSTFFGSPPIYANKMIAFTWNSKFHDSTHSTIQTSFSATWRRAPDITLNDASLLGSYPLADECKKLLHPANVPFTWFLKKRGICTKIHKTFFIYKLDPNWEFKHSVDYQTDSYRKEILDMVETIRASHPQYINSSAYGDEIPFTDALNHALPGSGWSRNG